MNFILLLLLITTTFFSGFTIAEEKAEIRDLNSLETLKRDFNVHQNKVRIVTLLSPT
jgi:hypothetical protein